MVFRQQNIGADCFILLHSVTASGPAKNRYDIGYGKPINLDKCLGDWWTSEDDGLEIDSVDMFKRLAFGDSDCGDLREPVL